MTRSSVRIVLPAAAAILLSVLMACGGTGGAPTGPDPSPTLAVVVDGWLERGGIAELTVTRAGDPISAERVVWSAEPATSVEFIEKDRARLLDVGTVTFRARVEQAEATKVVDVVVPPVLVFALRAPDGNEDLWRSTLDGQEVTRLTQATGDDGDPTVGGGTIVFVSNRDGRSELYRMTLAGGAAERLTNSPAEERDPSLSRDGTRLAFSRPKGDGRVAVWMAESDGTGERTVTSGLGFAGSLEATPSWSPEGDRLALMSTARGDADVWDVAIDGSDAVPVASGEGPDLEPAWDPNGDRIVYAAVAGDDLELFLLDLVQETVTRLTDRVGSDGQPAWLPDGRIVYTAWTDGDPELRWLDPADPGRSHPVPTPEGSPQNPHGIFE